MMTIRLDEPFVVSRPDWQYQADPNAPLKAGDLVVLAHARSGFAAIGRIGTKSFPKSKTFKIIGDADHPFGLGGSYSTEHLLPGGGWRHDGWTIVRVTSTTKLLVAEGGHA